MPYIGNSSQKFVTADDVTITDDLTVTDDASVGGDLTVTGTTQSAHVGIDVAPHADYGLTISNADDKHIRFVNGSEFGFIQLSDAGDLKVWAHGSDNLILQNGDGSGTARLTVNTDGNIDVETGDIFFSTAGKGICLGATSATAANTLHDYEEGTWTPRLGAATAGVATPGSNNAGYYTKIGQFVHVTGFLVWSEITTSMSGDLQLQGLPFTVSNVVGNFPSQPITRMFNGFTNGSSIPHAFHAAPGTTVAAVVAFSGQGGSGQNWTGSVTASASGNIYGINLTYITSD